MTCKYRYITCFDFEDLDEKSSNLYIGVGLDILTLPDIDDEVWTESCIIREEENLWILTDVSPKFMENYEIERAVFNQIRLEMNSNEGYEVDRKYTNFNILIRKNCTYKETNNLWQRLRNDFLDYFKAIENQKLTTRNRKEIKNTTYIRKSKKCNYT